MSAFFAPAFRGSGKSENKTSSGCLSVAAGRSRAFKLTFPSSLDL
jgi:hypothetical protein